MPDVFLSYARRDSADFVRRLSGALEAEGIDVWVDLDDIPAASDWQEDLRDGVLQSDCFCFVISPSSAESRFCRDELSEAEARNKRVIPLVHEPVAEAELPRVLQRLNWVPQRGKFADDFDVNLKVLAEAIRTDLEATRAHTRWEAAAAAWDAKDRDQSLLPRGSELREAESWIATQTGRDPAPTALQAEFVEAARRASERRRRLIFAATATALAVSVVLGVVALLQRNEARDQRDAARSNELASAAQANLEVDPELSIILAREAVETVDTPRAEQALAQSISTSLVRMRLSDPGGAMNGATYSPDGKLIATSGSDGVKLWDAASGEPVRTITSERAFDADFTSDSNRLAVAGADGALATYDVSDGSTDETFDTGAGDLYAVDVSPDDKSVGVAGQAGYAASFPMAGGEGAVLDGHAARLSVNSIAFSPSSKALLTASGDGTARLWLADSGKELATFQSPEDFAVPGIEASRPQAPSSDAEFTPDGKSIATIDVAGTVSLWPLETDAKPTPFTDEGDGFYYTVAFDSDRDALIATGNGRADAYDLESGERLASYQGQSGIVNQAQASPDGSRLVTAAQDGTARVWDFSSIRFSGNLPILVTDVGFDGEGKRLATSGVPAVVNVADETADRIPFKATVAVAELAWDPAADRIALGGTDGIVRIVDPVTGEAAGPVIDAPGEDVNDLQWSADGKRLMVLALGGGVTVYDTDSGDEVGSIDSLMIAAALSPDGTRLAYYGAATKADLSVRIENVETGEQVGSLVGHTAGISSIAWSADGTRIVTGSDDATARIWDPDTGEQLAPRLNNQGLNVAFVAISNDGRFVATVGTGLKVWNAETGREVMSVPGFETDVAFSPDGKLIAALGPGDKTVSVINCDVCVDDVDSLLALADERITREPSASERNEYLDR